MEWSECVKRVGKPSPVCAQIGTSIVEYDMIVAVSHRYLPKQNITIRQVTLLDKNHHSESIVQPNQIIEKDKG